MDSVYDLAKASIMLGGFKLAEKLRELTSIMIVGQIDPGEYEQLAELARQYANEETKPEEANILGVLRLLKDENEDIKARLAKLEAANGEEPVEDDYPAWERWDGIIEHGYKFGAKVTHLGKRYISEFVGYNTWEPGLLGTEQIWKLVG